MPPKGSSKKEVATPDVGVDGNSKLQGVVIELGHGEKDTQNISFRTEILEAFALVTERFPDIMEKQPLTIAEGGEQTPFTQENLKKACGNGGTYICGINLAWLNPTFSATPGVPVRKTAVRQVLASIFGKPTALEQLHVAVPSVDFVVRHHKGALMRVNPEESPGRTSLRSPGISRRTSPMSFCSNGKGTFSRPRASS